jgi:hypothetical protein
MSRAARSIFAFGLYVLVLGLLLITFPNLVIEPFGFPAAREPWIRVLGVVVVVLGCYYIQAARQEVTAFFRWTIWGRATILGGFTALVLAGLAAPALIAFGTLDAAGALWTALALRAGSGTESGS